MVLVDELAHTNAPGSRHAKRWQDVEDLLDAGITVLTTVNIQHLESLNDVIERITGVRQQETVPDEVVRRAQQVELVDITPEALRRRMAHGNVYAPEKVDAAMANYFQPRNLTALREMALLWLADQVEVALQRYRTDQQVTDIWETRERVVVALTGGPESETVLRRAARIAERSGSAELFAVHVLRGDGLAGAPVGALAGLRRLAEDVGASFHTVVGDDVPTALLEFARGVDATQLVIGTSGGPGPARVWSRASGRGSSRTPGTSTCTWSPTRGRPRDPPAPAVQRGPGHPPGRRVGAGPAAAAAAVGIGVLGRDVLGLSTDVVLFFLATVVTALVGGLGPALLAAVAGGLLLNFFLTPPLYTFTIAERENVITLVAMVLVAVLVALVVDRAARRAQQAAQARAEAALLASFSRTVLARADPLAPAAGEGSGSVRAHLGRRPAAPGRPLDDLRLRRPARDCTRPDQADVDVAVDPDTHLVGPGRALARRRPPPARGRRRTGPARPAQPAGHRRGRRGPAPRRRHRAAHRAALGRRPRPAHPAGLDQGRGREPARPDRCGCPTHDRAELAARSRSPPTGSTGVVDNLLDSSRLATGAVRRSQPVGYDEVAPLALRGLDGADRVRIEIDERLPEVLADPGLLERVVANVVDNACGTARARRSRCAAARTATQVELRVVDTGPGVPRGQADRLFAPFQRLGDRDPRGLGLGLSVGPRVHRGHGRHAHRRGHPGRRAHRGHQPPAATCPPRSPSTPSPTPRRP